MDLQLICIAGSYVIIFGILFFIVAQKRKVQANLKKKTKQEQQLKEEYEESKQVTDSFCQERAQQVQMLLNQVSQLTMHNEQLSHKLHVQLLETTHLQGQLTTVEVQKNLLEATYQQILQSNEDLLRDNRLLLDREKKWIRLAKELKTLCEFILKSLKERAGGQYLSEKMQEVLFKNELDALLANLQIKRTDNNNPATGSPE